MAHKPKHQTTPAHVKLSRRAKRHLKRKLHHMHMEQLGWHRRWKNWRYKNTTYLIISLLAFLVLSTTPLVASIIETIGGTGYIGAFLMGMLLTSVFTAAPAAVVLFNLADTLHPIEIALLAGAGAMLGDYIIYRFIKDEVFTELEPLFHKITTHKITKLYYTPYFMWLTPILGLIFIASPGPDEVGIGLLGLSKIERWQFLLVTFLLNFIGIFIVVILAKAT